MFSREKLVGFCLDSFDNFSEIPPTSYLKKRGVYVACAGKVEIENYSIKVIIGLKKSFPITKPLFFLKPFDSLGFIPHIDPDGYVCFVQDQNLVLDIENPIGVIKACYQRATKTIYEGITGVNSQDFLEEFEAYWNRFVNGDTIFYSTFKIGKDLKIVHVGINENLRVLSDDKAEIKDLNRRFGIRRPGRIVPGIYIPISVGLIHQPPKYPEFWEKSFVNELVQKSISRDKLKDKVKNFKKKDEYVILGIPLSDDKLSVVGLRYRKKSNEDTHPLLDPRTNCRVVPFEIHRLDYQAILPRGGGDVELIDKKVLVIGCGSLGSQIALELAKSGLGNLTLCDPETLRRENIYRHVLGLESVGKYKVIALKDIIEQQLPYINVRIEPFGIEELKNFDFGLYDAAVFATGDPTVNLYFNKMIRVNWNNIGLIHTWIEPYGIGGHALCSKPSKKGCYNCLYTRELINNASFCHQIQPKAFTKSISGCSGLFVPFGFMDATRTSLIASSLTLKVLSSEELDPEIISWKGDPTHFLKEGFNLSERYLDQNEVQLFTNRKEFINEECSVCGKK